MIRIAILFSRDSSSGQQAQELRSFFRDNVASDVGKAQKELEDLRKQRSEFEKSVPDTMVMAEMEKPRDTFIKVRGQ